VNSLRGEIQFPAVKRTRQEEVIETRHDRSQIAIAEINP
jgi:hypothetical protein